jgi:periplasmic protein TonB
MFEQSTLSNGPSGVRAWTTFLGLTSQVVLVTLAVLAPLVFPQALPTARFLETLVPPLPPAPAPKPLGEVKQVPASGKVLKPVPWSLIKYQPASIPNTIYKIADEPAPGGLTVPGSLGTWGDAGTGVVGALLRDLNETVRVAAPLIPKPAAKPATPEAPPVIQRFREGGRVSLGALLHKVEPQYPALAKTAHVSGVVELECVVGVDGHIQEVKVKSGNPLLIQAAVQAAWQWLYSATKLNGTPIEIITNLTFSFKLN